MRKWTAYFEFVNAPADPPRPPGPPNLLEDEDALLASFMGPGMGGRPPGR